MIRVLTVGAHAPPDHRTGLAVHSCALLGDLLAVAFHIELLQMFRQVFQVFIVRQYSVASRSPEVVVPDAEHRHDNGEVLLRRSVPEMAVHGMGAGQQGVKVVHTYYESNWQANGRPEGIASADPVPHREDVCQLNAELVGCIDTGSDSQKVFAHCTLIAAVSKEPLSRYQTVFQCFLSAERLGLHEEQGRFRVKPVQGFGNIGAIDIGDEVTAKVPLPIGFKGLYHQLGAEKRSTDAYTDDIGKGPAGVPGSGAILNLSDQLAHPCQGGVDLRDDVVAVYLYLCAGWLAQGGVQGRSVLGDVDHGSAEKVHRAPLNAAGSGKIGQCLQHAVVQAVAGKVQCQPGAFNQVTVGALQVFTVQIAHGAAGQLIP